MAVHKRHTIGLLSTMFHSDYMMQIISGVKDICEQEDVNLLIYSGRLIDYPWNNEHQQNIIYEFVNKNNCDALIVPAGTLYNFISRDEITAYNKRFSGIPLVSIGMKLPGIPSVMIDNTIGLREEMDHFIQVHHYRKIGFIAGSEGNYDARERLGVYLQALKDNGLEINPDFIIPGDFTPLSGEIAVKIILDERKLKLDVLIGANDDCIIEAARFFQARGIAIPQDLAVGGFDNTESSNIMTPPLTTVEQPLYEMGKVVSRIAIDLTLGKSVPEVTILPTRLVKRSSCGCIPNINAMFSFRINPQPSKKAVSGLMLDFDTQDTVRKALEKIPMMESEKNKVSTKMAEELDQLQKILRSGEPREVIGESFIQKFYHILIQSMKSNARLVCWQHILTELFETALAMDYRSDDWHILLNNCRILLSELNQQEIIGNKGSLKNSLFFYRDSMARLISSSSIQKLLEQLRDDLPRLDFHTVFIAFYQKKIKHQFKQKWNAPQNAKVILAINQDEQIQLTQEEKYYSIRETLLPFSLFPKDKRWSLAATPINFGETHYGLFVVDITGKEGVLLESFFIQMNSVIHDCFLFDSKQRAEKRLIKVLNDLKEAHLKLSEISETDEMTGLYNRRGFLNLAQQNLDLALRMKKSGLVIFADMDGLKKINDTYGHKEGDLAIMETAEILREIFRNSDIVARLGGDEFTILAIDTPDGFLDVLQSRLLEALKRHNSSIKKPYQISISIGAVPFSDKSSHSLEKLMIEADKLLYEKKRNRKKI